jgi:hypothetical protein
MHKSQVECLEIKKKRKKRPVKRDGEILVTLLTPIEM